MIVLKVVKLNFRRFQLWQRQLNQEGDFFVPDLYLENEDYENDYIIGKYGNLRLKYLKNHKKAEYIIMFMNKTLRKHIVETDKQAKQRFEILMKQIL